MNATRSESPPESLESFDDEGDREPIVDGNRGAIERDG